MAATEQELRDALSCLVSAVGNMKVPQNTAEAALQVSLTLGPAYQQAKRTLEK